ncbi:MAG: hypothetical protein LBJ92_03375 [Holosporales bacterium]|jgi:hypothetical protein|nr:hypothetical protein [Holosporales bacterium]
MLFGRKLICIILNLLITIDVFGAIIPKNSTAEQAAKFARDVLGTCSSSAQELSEFNGDSNTHGVNDPQIYGVARMPGSKWSNIVKSLIERARREVDGAQLVARVFGMDPVFDGVRCYVPQYISIISVDGRISRPVPLLEFDADSILPGQTCFQFMDLAPGVTLYRYLEERMFGSVASLLPIFGKLGRAMGAMHAAGCYHMDLHEFNIIVDPRSDTMSFIDFQDALVLSAVDPDGCTDDFRKTFWSICKDYFLKPVIADPSIFDERNRCIGEGLRVFGHEYRRTIGDEVQLRGPINMFLCTDLANRHILVDPEKNNHKYDNEENVDIFMLGMFKVLLSLGEFLHEKGDVEEQIPYMEPENEHGELTYARQCTRLIEAIFYRFTQEDMIEYIDLFGISRGKEWIGPLLELF